MYSIHSSYHTLVVTFIHEDEEIWPILNLFLADINLTFGIKVYAKDKIVCVNHKEKLQPAMLTASHSL